MKLTENQQDAYAIIMAQRWEDDAPPEPPAKGNPFPWMPEWARQPLNHAPLDAHSTQFSLDTADESGPDYPNE